MVFIVELVRRNKLKERYSIVWFAAGAGIGHQGPRPPAPPFLANVLGVRDITIALFSLLLIVLLGLALNGASSPPATQNRSPAWRRSRPWRLTREPDWADVLDEHDQG